MIYPTNEYKIYWDVFITTLLLFSCILTPMHLALYNELSRGWNVTNSLIDVAFFIDIIIIFNTAIYNDDLEIIDDRRVISMTYLKSWFCVDFFAIIPFDLMFKS